MSYVIQTLAKDERVIERAHFNWTYNFESWFWLILSFIPMIALCYAQISGIVAPERIVLSGWVASTLGIALSTIMFIAHMIKLKTTEIVVTSYRFVYKTGLISRNTKEVSLNKIEEITLQQSIAGRLFGYGKLTLRGTGVGVIELPDLDNPVDLRRQIETAKSDMRRESTSEANDSA